MEMDNSYDISIPEHLLHLILLYLPVVSLLRFKSVCKSWLSLIESSSFIYQHLDHHQHQQQQLIALWPHEDRIASLYSDPIHLPIINQGCWNLNLIASCNGLIVLHNEDRGNVYLWNPATKQFRSLPQSPAPWPSELLDSYIVEFSMGFGFDDNTKVYKIVRFSVNAQPNMPCKFGLEIYNLNTDSWRIIEEDATAGLPRIGHIFCHPKEPYQKKMYLWAAAVFSQDSMYFHDTIIYFDFSKEVFGTVALPPKHLRPIDFSNRSLVIIREKVAWIYQVGESLTYDVWLMNEFGNQDSWSKAYKIGPFEIVRWAIGFTEYLHKEKLLLLANKDQQLCLCDPVTQETQNLPLQGGLHVVAYRESLVRII